MAEDLPFEILCEILLLVSKDPDQDELQKRTEAYRKLSLVSHEWRAVVEAEQRMWADCTLRYNPEPPSTRSSLLTPDEKRKLEVEMLKRHYLRAGDLPLSIEVILWTYSRASHGDLEPLALFILSYGPRWKKLTFEVFFDTFARKWVLGLLKRAHSIKAATGVSPFSAVQDLTVVMINSQITRCSDFPIPALFPSIRQLDVLLVVDMDLSNVPELLAFPFLECLKLDIGHVEEADRHLLLRDILSRTPSLKHLNMTIGTPRGSLSSFTHRNLEILIINNFPIALGELGFLVLPALVELVIQKDIIENPDVVDLKGEVAGEADIPRLMKASILRMVEQSGCRLDVLNVPRLGLSYCRDGSDSTAETSPLPKALHEILVH